MQDAPVPAQVEDAPDQDMPENGAAEEGEEEEEEEEEEVEAQRVKIVSLRLPMRSLRCHQNHVRLKSKKIY